jgi:NADPH:quinone reductase-like Zn-dependent oxidoreductase
MMRSQQLTVTRVGPPESMELRTSQVAPPAPGQAVVRVQAAGVSQGDILLRVGLIPGGPKPPFVPGYDVAGVVEQVGEGVGDLVPGQPVVALVRQGGYSERLTVPAERLVPLPEGAGPVESAAVALNYFVAYQMLHRVSGLAAGDRVLVHGASGGVGIALLELSRLAGIECHGSASAAKQELVRRFGGHPFDYRDQDFREVVAGLPGGAVDAVFDAVGGWRHFVRSYRVLRRGGILVAYGESAALAGGKASKLAGGLGYLVGIALPKLLPDGRRTVFYSAWSLEKRQPRAYREDLAAVLRLLADGAIEPIIAKTMPLERAAAAQRLLEEGSVAGKLVLVTDPEGSQR